MNENNILNNTSENPWTLFYKNILYEILSGLNVEKDNITINEEILVNARIELQNTLKNLESSTDRITFGDLAANFILDLIKERPFHIENFNEDKLEKINRRVVCAYTLKLLLKIDDINNQLTKNEFNNIINIFNEQIINKKELVSSLNSLKKRFNP